MMTIHPDVLGGRSPTATASEHPRRPDARAALPAVTVVLGPDERPADAGGPSFAARATRSPAALHCVGFPLRSQRAHPKWLSRLRCDRDGKDLTAEFRRACGQRQTSDGPGRPRTRGKDESPSCPDRRRLPEELEWSGGTRFVPRLAPRERAFLPKCLPHRARTTSAPGERQARGFHYEAGSGNDVRATS